MKTPTTYAIPMEELLSKTGSLYKLVLMASRRAVELTAGAGKLIDVSPNVKLSIVALEEIRQGKVKLKEAVKK
ncbi:MAG: DNA-directed RNA polymerase subunit omega [Candidatus Omnitrophota bacterium]